MKNKKILYIAIAAIAVVLVAVLAIVFAGNNNGNDNGGTQTPAYANSVELLNKIWNTLPENSDEFPKYAKDEESGEISYYFVGGDMTMNEETWEPIVVYNGAGNVSLTEEMLYTYYFPMDMVSKIDEAASIYSMMGNGLFTVAAFHVTNEADISEIASKIEEGVQNEFWMCCIPYRVVLVQAGDYLISIYGQDAVEQFLNVTLSTIEGAKVLIDNPISR